jgi:hypothetical protein
MNPNLFSRAARLCVVCMTLLCLVGAGPCSAQTYGPSLSSFGSVIPLWSTVEQYIGPILPPEGLGNSFRSEFGFGIATAKLQGALLKGSESGEIDLRRDAQLDRQPLRLDVYGNLRIWRLGLRGNYWNFDSRSKHRNHGSLDLTGLIVGADVDLICKKWLTAGVQADYFLFDPQFQGALRLAPQVNENFTLTVAGQKPFTVGPYVRYVPPEILNFPLHVEAFFKASLNSTALTYYGARFVFRPQIYRFDIACRLFVEKMWVQFSTEPENQIVGATPFFEEWSLDVEYELYGLDFAVYF